MAHARLVISSVSTACIFSCAIGELRSHPQSTRERERRQDRTRRVWLLAGRLSINGGTGPSRRAGSLRPPRTSTRSPSLHRARRRHLQKRQASPPTDRFLLRPLRPRSTLHHPLLGRAGTVPALGPRSGGRSRAERTPAPAVAGRTMRLARTSLLDFKSRPEELVSLSVVQSFLDPTRHPSRTFHSTPAVLPLPPKRPDAS